MDDKLTHIPELKDGGAADSALPTNERPSCEKILLVEDLWESIAADASVMPIPESHKSELKRRLALFDHHPGDLISLEELKSGIINRKL